MLAGTKSSSTFSVLNSSVLERENLAAFLVYEFLEGERYGDGRRSVEILLVMAANPALCAASR